MTKRRITTLGLATLTVMAVAVLLWAAGSAGASPPLGPAAQSGTPLLLNYQGRLVDPDTGEPVPDGNYSITFRIYDAASGGTLVWAETQTVQVEGGLFNALLGSVTPLSAADFDGTARWLELEVEGETLTPRQRIVSTAYAIQAEWAKNAPWDGLTGMPAGFADGVDDDTLGGLSPCGNGQVAKWNDGAGQWECADDDSGAGGDFWALTGNAGTTYGTNFLGTTDGVSLTLAVNNTVAMRLEPTGGTPNVIGGHISNTVASGVVGATIGGGGTSGSANTASGQYATVGGGYGNTASGWDTVGGGEGNTASGGAATVGGGGYNTASDCYATVGGGHQNTASGYATVGGGECNTASGYATVGGGLSNTASGDRATVGGGYYNSVSADYGTIAGGGPSDPDDNPSTTNNRVTDEYGAIGGGGGNQAGDGDGDTTNARYTTVGGGYENTASGEEATVGGGACNTASQSYATVGGGYYNKVSVAYGTIAGGGPSDPEDNPSTTNNRVTDDYGTIGGGGNNQAGDNAGTMSDAAYATVGGGLENTASGIYATVGGGWDNEASGYSSTVGGGEYNEASGGYATVGGGFDNYASDDYATVGGGDGNRASGYLATVGGGGGNEASGPSDGDGYATVGGGYHNSVNADYGTIAGGGPSDPGAPSDTNNRVTDNYGAIGGGGNNQAGNGDGDTTNAAYATVGGGGQNTASGKYATVGGGYQNTAGGEDGEYATVGGGQDNTASFFHATVGGGLDNTASRRYATVVGGNSNVASSYAATVGGGEESTASAPYSYAVGRRAKANNNGCFVWGDSYNGDVTCNVEDAFIVRASGGITMYTNSALSSGVKVAAGGGSWSSVSDRELKENLAPVDIQKLLARLAEIPVTTWNYKAQDPSIRHIGPMAQDFNALIEGLGGEGEKYINTLDADGVALAAVQGLYQLSQEQAVRIEELEAENAAQQAQIADLEERMIALESPSRSPLGSWGPLGLLFGGLLVGLVVVRRNDFGRRQL